MEQATPTDGGSPTVQQMFATLLREITSLRKQNEEQERQLDHLRGDVSLLVERFNVPIQDSRVLEFQKFSELPSEIRKMIWELAVPARLLRLSDVNQETYAPSALSVPSIAHVCQESRSVVLSRNSVTALTGRSTHLEYPSQLWQLDYTEPAWWTWFTPYKDKLLINPLEFELNEYHSIVDAAEHFIIDGCRLFDHYFEHGYFDDDNRVTLDRLSEWVHLLVMEPEFTPLTGDPIYNIRTVDFAMTDVTRIDQDFPPNLVRRLFAGDRVRIVDLRDKEDVRRIQRMLDHELSQVILDVDWKSCQWFRLEFNGLRKACKKFQDAGNGHFPHVRASFLHALANSYYQRSRLSPAAPLPRPIDMEVTWVKELTKRVNVRPVHVFVLDDGMSHM